MIHDSKWGFEFSQLNFLLSWALWKQNKKIKIIGIINAWKLSQHFKHQTLLKFVFFFLVFILLPLMISNRDVPLLNILHILIRKTKFIVKNLWKCIFRASRSVSFSYFPKVALNREVREGRRVPPIPFRIFVDHFIIFS